MLCLQNGLCEARVARIAGEARTVGAVVGWGAAMPEPGVFDKTASGGFTLGRMDGTVDERLDEIARALECIGPTETTRNLAGKRWSKLAINCAISLARHHRRRPARRPAAAPLRAPSRARGHDRGRSRRAAREREAREGERHARPRLDRPDRGRARGGGLPFPARQARPALRRRPALPPHAKLDARGHRARPPAGRGLPQRRSHRPRPHTRHPHPGEHARPLPRLGSRDGRTPSIDLLRTLAAPSA